MLSHPQLGSARNRLCRIDLYLAQQSAFPTLRKPRQKLTWLSAFRLWSFSGRCGGLRNSLPFWLLRRLSSCCSSRRCIRDCTLYLHPLGNCGHYRRVGLAPAGSSGLWSALENFAESSALSTQRVIDPPSCAAATLVW